METTQFHVIRELIHMRMGIVIYASYYKQLSADIKMYNYKIKTCFVRPGGPKARAKNRYLFYDIILIFVENCLIFQYGLEPVLIQRI